MARWILTWLICVGIAHCTYGEDRRTDRVNAVEIGLPAEAKPPIEQYIDDGTLFYNENMGAVIEPMNRLMIIRGSLLVKTSYQVQDFINDAVSDTFNQAARFLDALKGKTLTVMHARTLRHQITVMTYLFRQLVLAAPNDLLTALNHLSLEGLESQWLVMIETAFNGIIIKNGSIVAQPTQAPAHMANALALEVKEPITKGWNWGITPMRSKIRKNRAAIFSGFGKIVSSIFDLATTEDIEKIQKQFARAGQKIMTSIKKVNINLTGFAASINNVIAQAKEATSALEKMSEAVAELDMFVCIANGIHNFEATIQLLLALTLDVSQKKNLLTRGIVPPVLKYRELLELINEGEQKFADEALKFPFFITRSNYSQALAYLTAKPLDNAEFVISIPFVYPEAFNMFHIYPFPVNSPGNGSFMVEIRASYVGVNPAETKFITMADINDCTTTLDHEVHLCNDQPLRNIGITPSCEVALLGLADKSRCLYRERKDTEVFVQKVAESYFLFLPKKLPTTLTCPTNRGKAQRSTFEVLEGPFVLSPPCALVSREFSLHTIALELTQYNLSANSLKSLPNGSVDIPNNKLLPELVELRNIVHKLHNVSVQSVKNVDSLFEDTGNNYNVSISTSVTLLVLAGIASAVLFIYFRRRIHRIKRNPVGGQGALQIINARAPSPRRERSRSRTPPRSRSRSNRRRSWSRSRRDDIYDSEESRVPINQPRPPSPRWSRKTMKIMGHHAGDAGQQPLAPQAAPMVVFKKPEVEKEEATPGPTPAAVASQTQYVTMASGVVPGINIKWASPKKTITETVPSNPIPDAQHNAAYTAAFGILKPKHQVIPRDSDSD